MFATPVPPEPRVAIFLDCDNANPANLEYAVQVAQRFGRLVVRRGYGNHVTLASKWQRTLMQNSFAPCLQFQFASGKNTADLALAIDVMEVLLEKRADTFVLVTSDSDFVGLAQKIKERGATVHIVGEVKSPQSLRQACDQFFECMPLEPIAVSCPVSFGLPYQSNNKATPSYPNFVITELSLLLKERQTKKVTLASFGAHLKTVNPAFDPKLYGHKKLSTMLKGYPGSITLTPDEIVHYTVALARPLPQPAAGSSALEPSTCSGLAPSSTSFLGWPQPLGSAEPMAPHEKPTHVCD